MKAECGPGWITTPGEYRSLTCRNCNQEVEWETNADGSRFQTMIQTRIGEVGVIGSVVTVCKNCSELLATGEPTS